MLMKLYTHVVLDLRIRMKEDNRGLKTIKGDNYLFRAGFPLCFR